MHVHTYTSICVRWDCALAPMRHASYIYPLPPTHPPVSLQDNEGKTALHWCAQNGYMHRFAVLLESGAADAIARAELLMAVDRHGKTCIDSADTDDTRDKILEMVRNIVTVDASGKISAHAPNLGASGGFASFSST